ncbi:hypothetical protein AB0N26_32265 [Streptomyces cellulosae]
MRRTLTVLVSTGTHSPHHLPESFINVQSEHELPALIDSLPDLGRADARLRKAMASDAWLTINKATRQAVADLYRETAVQLAAPDASRAEILRRFDEVAGRLQEDDFHLDILVESVSREADSEVLGVPNVVGKASSRPNWGCPVAGCATLVKGDHTRPTGRPDCAVHAGTLLNKLP